MHKPSIVARVLLGDIQFLHSDLYRPGTKRRQRLEDGIRRLASLLIGHGC